MNSIREDIEEILTRDTHFSPLSMIKLKSQTDKLETYINKVTGWYVEKIDGMSFVKEESDITQSYQDTFIDGYNQAIEDVVDYLQSIKETDK